MDSLDLTIDLISQRFVYPGDLGIGVRQIELTKGNTYDVNLSFVSGYSGVSFTPTGLFWSLCMPNRQNTPFISLSGISGGSFGLFVGSPVLDYAINGLNQVVLDTMVSFSGNGTGYYLGKLTTVLYNNPSLYPQTEYYPLNGNPAGYTTQEALNASGNALQAQISALDIESGTFYPNSNPSGFEQASDILSFNHSLPSGASSSFVSFSPAFSQIPVVSYALNIPASGSLYALATSGVTQSGLGVYLSAPLDSAGYSLSVIARV